jgi:hypothetical protein
MTTADRLRILSHGAVNKIVAADILAIADEFDALTAERDALIDVAVWQDVFGKWWHRDSGLTNFPTKDAARTHYLEYVMGRAAARKTRSTLEPA